MQAGLVRSPEVGERYEKAGLSPPLQGEDKDGGVVWLEELPRPANPLPMPLVLLYHPEEGAAMKGKDFLSIAELSPDEVWPLVQAASRLKRGVSERPLEGKMVALLFEKPSLRTRVSFEVGVRQLGGECVYLSRDDVGLGVREPVADVARVLDRWVDAIVARVFSHDSLEQLARHTTIPVINALSDREHPCQAMADVLTIHEHKDDLSKVKMTFVGDGNNIAVSLALACAALGMDFTLASPEGYRVPGPIWEEAQRRAGLKGSALNWIESPREAVSGTDVVYTDVWVSMGEEGDAERKLNDFAGYQVNEELMDYAAPDAVFMHDMPAHRGEEVSEGMLDDPRSVVFDQAENRLHAQKAVLAALFPGGGI
jgi:ornithine carbamoyltransferase